MKLCQTLPPLGFYFFSLNVPYPGAFTELRSKLPLATESTKVFKEQECSKVRAQVSSTANRKFS
jgi:hypothetical protein